MNQAIELKALGHESYIDPDRLYIESGRNYISFSADIGETVRIFKIKRPIIKKLISKAPLFTTLSQEIPFLNDNQLNKIKTLVDKESDKRKVSR